MAVLPGGGRFAAVPAQPDTDPVRRCGHPRLYLQSAGAAVVLMEDSAHAGRGAGDVRLVAAVCRAAVDHAAAAGEGIRPVRDAPAGLGRGGAPAPGAVI